MKEVNNNPSLTLEELRHAVDEEHVAIMKQKRPHSTEPETDTSPVMIDEITEPAVKRIRPDDVEMASPVPFSGAISAQVVESEALSLINMTQLAHNELAAAWLARDGDAPPMRPDPPLFSPSPPKLGDPSGSDLVGNEIALMLNQSLLKSSDGDISGSIILDVCKGCWMMTALKEKETSLAISTLDAKLVSTECLVYLFYSCQLFRWIVTMSLFIVYMYRTFFVLATGI
jgi:hypothetical protein